MSSSHTSLFRNDTQPYSNLFTNTDLSAKSLTTSGQITSGDTLTVVGAIQGASLQTSGNVSVGGALIFPNGGASQLTFYKTQTAQPTFSVGTSGSPTQNIYFERVGNKVFITLRANSITVAGSPQAVGAPAGSVPLDFRPLADQEVGVVRISQAGAPLISTFARLAVLADGSLAFNLAGGTAFTNGTMAYFDINGVYMKS